MLKPLARPILRQPMLARSLGPLTRGGVFMHHIGRCGSTALSTLLDQHPAIKAFDEIFERDFSSQRPAPDCATALQVCRLRALWRMALVEAKFPECLHVGYLDETIPSFVETLNRNGYNRHIILYRRNHLARLISGAVGRARNGTWHFQSGARVPETTVRIDPEATRFGNEVRPILELIDYIEDQYARLRNALRDKLYLELIYEDDIMHDPRLAYTRVCDWLGIKAVQVDVKTTRATNRTYPEIVENWDDLAEAFTGTKHSWMPEELAVAADA